LRDRNVAKPDDEICTGVPCPIFFRGGGDAPTVYTHEDSAPIIAPVTLLLNSRSRSLFRWCQITNCVVF